MSLGPLGWSEEFKLYDSQIESAARIIAIHRSHFRAITLKGEINIHFSNSFSEPLAVGDWVLTNSLFVDEQGEPATSIKELIPRKSKFSRATAEDNTKEQLIATNVDTVFVVTSINQDLNISRLERYLLLITKGMATPVVILSKVDLEPSYVQTLSHLKEQLGDNIQIIACSLINKTGLDEIKNLIPEGSTSVFVGSSGVGKSSLVNFLLEKETQAVKEIRKDDDKGKHTTTSRQMFFMPQGGMIIDTPGIRGVSVFGSDDYLSDTFFEIEELATHCKFSNCSHATEPGCAIIHALNTQKLEQKQWDNYNKLSKEMAFNNKKINKRNSSNIKQKWKKNSKNYKSKK